MAKDNVMNAATSSPDEVGGVAAPAETPSAGAAAAGTKAQVKTDEDMVIKDAREKSLMDEAEDTAGGDGKPDDDREEAAGGIGVEVEDGRNQAQALATSGTETASIAAPFEDAGNEKHSMDAGAAEVATDGQDAAAVKEVPPTSNDSQGDTEGTNSKGKGDDVGSKDAGASAQPSGPDSGFPKENLPSTTSVPTTAEATTPALTAKPTISKDDAAPAPVAEESTKPVPEETANNDEASDVTEGEGPSQTTSLRDHEDTIVGARLLFHPDSGKNYGGWDNLRWMSLNGVRKITYGITTYRYFRTRKILMWGGQSYEPRELFVYEDPLLLLLVRPAKDVAELAQLLSETERNLPSDAMKQNLVVESVIDPNTSKLRLSPLTTVTSIERDIDESDSRRRSCFELITPTETIVLSAVVLRPGAERALTNFGDSGAHLETSKAELLVQQTLCAAHASDGTSKAKSEDMSWKHQVILGTLHSYVMVGDLEGLRKAIAAAIDQQKQRAQSLELTQEERGSLNFLDPKILDQQDEKGLTALHYACSSRNSKIVTELVHAGANTYLQVGDLNRFPIHLSALHLDFMSLDTILKASKRPNVLDKHNRTPMYVAITEGRSVGNMKDPHALDRCLSVLHSHGGKLFDVQSNQKHPVSELASLWEHENISVLMNHIPFRYPLSVRKGMDAAIGITVSAMYQYPIHQALIALRRMIIQSTMTHAVDPKIRAKQNAVVGTLEALVKCGFEPNERIEGLCDRYFGDDELIAHTGFSPLQIVIAAIFDIESASNDIDAGLRATLLAVLGSAAEALFKVGARLLDSPPFARPATRNTLPCSFAPAAEAMSTNGSMFDADRSKLKISSMKQLESMLGGSSIIAAQTIWGTAKTVPGCGTAVIHQDNKSPIPDSAAPGGSDEKSCSICWKAFGTLMNRKHRCRVTTRHVCDECSGKRIVENGAECRISDGQFILAQTDHAIAESRRLQQQQQQQQQQARGGGVTSTSSQAKPSFISRAISSTSSTSSVVGGSKRTSTSGVDARLAKLEAQTASQRESLFDGVMQNMTKAVFGDVDETAQRGNDMADQTNGLAARLGQTRDALNERGEKLNTLADKSDRLVNASQDFASMAKELNRKTQSQGLFW